MNANLHRRCIVTVLFTIVVTAILLSTGIAAPIMRTTRVSQEMQTLAGIHRIHFMVMPLPAPIENIGVTAAKVRGHCSKMLEHAGFKLVEEGRSEVILRLSAFYRSSESVPNASGFVWFLTFEQPVRIERLDHSLRIPTWTGADIGIESNDRLDQTMMEGLDRAIDGFLMKWKVASRE